MNGPQPLSYSDMRAWTELTGAVVLAGEWHAICRVDSAFLDAVADEQREREERSKEKPK